MSRILFICHRIPYPPNKGDKIRSFNFIRHLAATHEIHLAFMVDNKEDRKNIKPLKKFSKNIFYETISPKTKKVTSTFQALLTCQPVSIPYFYSRALQHKIDNFLDNNPIDTVFCFSSPTAEYLYRSRHYDNTIKNACKIMDFVDVDSHKWRQYAATNMQPLRWLYTREARLLLQYEKKIADSFQHTLLVSEAEKKLLNQYFPTSNTTAIGNGVDLQHFSPVSNIDAVNNRTAERPRSYTIVFTGAMDYWPNIDGVKWFANDIFPIIRENIPGIQFQIVGSNPSPEVKALEKIEGVSVTGFVTDIREYIAAAEVCVIPLRIARGIQNKVLEAMSMGKAVVCSPEAMEGIAAVPGKDLVTAEDSTSFAQAVIQLLKNKNLQQTLEHKARICMEKNYSWPAKLANLDILLDINETCK